MADRPDEYDVNSSGVYCAIISITQIVFFFLHI